VRGYFQPQRGCVNASGKYGRRNRFAVAESLVLFSQGSRSGNPGLEAVTASRLSARYQVDHSENLTHLDQDLLYKWSIEIKPVKTLSSVGAACSVN
jgi:hypothetical protein